VRTQVTQKVASAKDYRRSPSLTPGQVELPLMEMAYKPLAASVAVDAVTNATYTDQHERFGRHLLSDPIPAELNARTTLKSRYGAQPCCAGNGIVVAPNPNGLFCPTGL
jgi:hypothetical protein